MTTTFFIRYQRAKGVIRYARASAERGVPKQPEKPEAAVPFTVFAREVAAECARLGDDNVNVVPFQRAARKKKSRKAKS